MNRKTQIANALASLEDHGLPSELKNLCDGILMGKVSLSDESHLCALIRMLFPWTTPVYEKSDPGKDVKCPVK